MKNLNTEKTSVKIRLFSNEADLKFISIAKYLDISIVTFRNRMKYNNWSETELDAIKRLFNSFGYSFEIDPEADKIEKLIDVVENSNKKMISTLKSM